MINRYIACIVVVLYPISSQAQDALQNCREALVRADFASAIKFGRDAGGFDGLMCTGRAQLAKNDFSGASATFAVLEKNLSDDFQKMVVYTFQARSANGLGNRTEALNLYEQGLALARKLNAPQAVMTNLNEIGQIYQTGKDFNAALKRYLEAYNFAGNDNERSKCNQLIANAYSVLGNHDKAIEHQLKSVILEERSGGLDQYLEARLGLAEFAMNAKDWARARKDLDGSLAVARENQSLLWEARILIKSAKLERLVGNRQQSDALIESARSIAQQIGDNNLIEDIKGTID